MILAKAYDSLTRLTQLLFLLAVPGVMADTEIHSCLLEDGTSAFQETPCPGPATTASDTSQNSDLGEAKTSGSESENPAIDDDVFDFVNPFDEPASPPTPVETTVPEALSKDREECEDRTRDAIDAIDLELRQNTDSKKDGRTHLAELLELTRQLRACKQL